MHTLSLSLSLPLLPLPHAHTIFCNNVTICTGHITLLMFVLYISILTMVKIFHQHITLVCPCNMCVHCNMYERYAFCDISHGQTDTDRS